MLGEACTLCGELGHGRSICRHNDVIVPPTAATTEHTPQERTFFAQLCARLACVALGDPSSEPERPRLGLRVVMLSDTHGRHRKVDCPQGDVLIHAGDFTQYGRLEHAHDFNAWLAEQPHPHKLVVLGNHEANAPWRKSVAAIVSNATVLCDQGVTISVPEGHAAAGASIRGDADAEADRVECAPAPGERTLSVFGTNFFWPMKSHNPHYGAIPAGVDVLVSHGPAAGHADGGMGCDELLRHCARVRPRLVVSGHIHGSHGVVQGRGELRGTTFVNAANAHHGHGHMGWPAVVLEI